MLPTRTVRVLTENDANRCLGPRGERNERGQRMNARAVQPHPSLLIGRLAVLESQVVKSGT
jgi:hypothetical protein